jgi:hypothetical protein
MKETKLARMQKITIPFEEKKNPVFIDQSN